jgi:hypothetical protein
MDPVMAAHAADLIRPGVAVPIHWGTFWPKAMGKVRPDRFVGPGSEFSVAAGELAAGVRVTILTPGERLDLGRSA